MSKPTDGPDLERIGPAEATESQLRDLAVLWEVYSGNRELPYMYRLAAAGVAGRLRAFADHLRPLLKRELEEIDKKSL